MRRRQLIRGADCTNGFARNKSSIDDAIIISPSVYSNLMDGLQNSLTGCVVENQLFSHRDFLLSAMGSFHNIGLIRSAISAAESVKRRWSLMGLTFGAAEKGG